MRTFVRRNIILSRRILSFLKATAPGPIIPFFCIGVRISLFQKQVYEEWLVVNIRKMSVGIHVS